MKENRQFTSEISFGKEHVDMAEWKKLPVGLENFREIQKSGFYYVDKTKLIEQLLENWSKVNLFTRPRRFGKTLNMSMLKSFFEIGADRTLFDGLYISRNQKLCEEYMGKYPVIFLSLKGIDGLSFEAAKYRLTELIGVEAERFAFLADSEKLMENERSKYRAIIHLVKPFLYSIHAEKLCREEHHTHQSELWPSDHNVGITAVIMSADWRQAYPHPWNIYHSLNG